MKLRSTRNKKIAVHCAEAVQDQTSLWKALGKPRKNQPRIVHVSEQRKGTAEAMPLRSAFIRVNQRRKK
ncbi:MAG: hypothetical protein WAL32_06275, partial [Terriglobales bacterium]